MSNSLFNTCDERYIEKSFNIIADGYTQSLVEGRMTPAEFDQALWRTPRTLISYYFKLTPSDELLPYYPLLSRLNVQSIELVDKLCPDRDDRLEKRQTINSYRDLFEFRPWALEDLNIYHRYLDNPKLWEQLIGDYADPISREQAELLLINSNTMPLRHDVSAIISVAERYL